jgi:hypothetical protein
MSIETRVAQKDKLHTLLTVQKLIANAGYPSLPEIEFLVNQAIAVMEAEDVAYVREQIAKLP